MTSQDPEKKRRRDRGDDGISWHKANKVYVGTISLGLQGRRHPRSPDRPGKIKTE